MPMLLLSYLVFCTIFSKVKILKYVLHVLIVRKETPCKRFEPGCLTLQGGAGKVSIKSGMDNIGRAEDDYFKHCK